MNGPAPRVALCCLLWGVLGSAQSWQPADPAPRLGGVRCDSVFDPATRRILCVGGSVCWQRVGREWRPVGRLPVPGFLALAPVLGRGRTVALVCNWGTVPSPPNAVSTWEWDGTTWQQSSPPVQPSLRQTPLAFHAGTARTVLFGGNPFSLSATPLLRDTWTWDGAQWQQQNPTTVPSGRRLHALATDATRDLVMMFGGRDDNGSTLDELWAWNGTDWRLESPAVRPPGRAQAALAYDEDRRRLVLFGGFDAAGAQLADTWEFDGTTWQARNPATTPQSAARPQLVYDRNARRVVLLGGPTDRCEAWQWDGVDWRAQGSQPIARPADYVSCTAYDPVRGRVVSWGNTAGDDRTREWDGSTWQVVPTGASPPALAWLSHAMLTTDWSRNEVLLVVNGVASPSDTWRWNGSTWAVAGGVPALRLGAAMACDLLRSRIVMFGGDLLSSRQLLQETWEWDGTRWLQQTPGNAPPARRDHHLAFDPVGGRILAFGGATRTQTLQDTWSWDGTTWTQANPIHQPPALAMATMANSIGGRIELVGTVMDRSSTETWSWDGLDWTLRATDPGVDFVHLATWPGRGTEVLLTSAGTFVNTNSLAAVSTFGTGCSLGAPVPRLDAAPRPVLGNPTFALAVDQAAANSLTALLVDTTTTNVAVGTCTLLVAPRVVLLGFTDNSGQLGFPVPVPANPALAGTRLVGQSLVLAQSGPGAGTVAFSNGLLFAVGN